MRKKIIVLVLLSFVALHFLLVGIYCTGIFAGSRLSYYGQFYAYPFFHQSWNLFVPPPSANYMLLAEFSHEGKRQTVDLFNEVITMHQSNRLAGLEPLVIAFVNSIFYFEKNAGFNDTANTVKVKPDVNFKILETIARGYFNYTRGYLPADLHLTLVVDNVMPGKRRVFY